MEPSARMRSILSYSPSPERSPFGRFGIRRSLWATAALLLAIFSIGGKVAYYGLPEVAAETAAEARLATFLESIGWEVLAEDELVSGRRVLIVLAPGCDAASEATLVAPNGELLAVLDSSTAQGYRVSYVERGVLKDRPSPTAYLQTRLRAAAASFGLMRAGSPIVAIMEPPGCDAAARAPWAEFDDS